jgi:hypothetical protein
MKRDDWMMLPPIADGLAKNLDPSKRARHFRSGKGASSGSGGGMDASWMETPEEKRKRLNDQVLGVSSGPVPKASLKKGESKQDQEAARRIMEHNVSFITTDDLMGLMICRRNTVASHCLSSTNQERAWRKQMIPVNALLIARRTLAPTCSAMIGKKKF